MSSIFLLDSKFGGLEKKIYNEVPAVLLSGRFLGLIVILSGDGEYDYNLIVHGNYKP